MTTIIKKILFATAILALFSSAYAMDLSGCTKKTYIVSGYYSPIRGQDFYYRGDFTRETTLNGQGKQGASGKYVFNGMVAAPKNYTFGTKIYFPGYGVGQVEDRGSAIVNAGQRGYAYDRIDIWMGKGEDGLKRALSFGKQTIVGYQCPAGYNIQTGFDYNNFPIIKDFFKQTFWGIGLYKGRRDERVKILQVYLKELGYFDYATTGYFGSITEKALCNYQVAYGLTTRASDDCGYMGPKTRDTLRFQVVARGLFKASSVKVAVQPQTVEVSTRKVVNFSRGFTKGEKSDEIKTLQEYLKELDYYDGEITGVYDSKTIDAVYRFQVDKQIIKSDNIASAGYLGPQTRKALSQAIDEKIALDEQKKKEEAEKLAIEKKIENNELFTRGFTKGEKAEEIKTLQEYLAKLDYYDGEITGVYDTKTIDAVYRFQLDNKIVTYGHAGSGYLGPQTRKTLHNAIASLN